MINPSLVHVHASVWRLQDCLLHHSHLLSPAGPDICAGLPHAVCMLNAPRVHKHEAGAKVQALLHTLMLRRGYTVRIAKEYTHNFQF